LASLEALFRLLRYYRAIPQDLLRVFMASSREELNTLLAQENSGLLVSSVTAEQFLCQRRISCLKMEQEEAIGRTQEPRRVKTGTLTALPPLAQTPMPEPVRKQQGISTLESRRIELEMGAGGDHDLPYTFTLPSRVPQLLAWTRLMARVQQGELQP
jgi:hypothetical protein